MEFVMGIVKSQLSPFNWKTILVLVLAVGALFFAFRLFGKFNSDPATAVAVVEQEQPPQQMMPQPQPPAQEEQQEQYEEEAQVQAAGTE
jgi:hypothetical protein